jgi:methyl-accepting chemotaxis protein
MSFLRNLPVGLKLALGSAAAVAMLAALVGLVRWNLHDATVAQQEAETAVELRRVALTSVAHTRDAQVALREMLLARQAAEVDAPLRMAETAMAAAIEALRVMERGAAAALQPEIEASRAALDAWLSGAQQVATLRKGMLALRDERLYPQMAEYDQAFEAVVANLEFELQGDAREEARQRLLTFHAAVNDGRLGVQRFLESQEEAQARRVRRAGAQAQVHFRGFVSQLQNRLEREADRLRAVSSAMAESSVQIVEAAEQIARIRTERTQPGQTRFDQLSARIAAELDTQASAASAAVLAAEQMVQDAVLWSGGGIALLLMLTNGVTARAITSPLGRVRAAIGAIAAGDASRPVPDCERRDEIGQIAVAVEGLRGTVGRAFAQQQMLEQLPVGVMTADPRDGFRITNVNPALREMLRPIEGALPCAADSIVGQPVELFHGTAEDQRALMADPARLPHRARVTIRGQSMDLSVSAIRDVQGGYVGPMIVWADVTQQARLADSFEAEVGGVVAAVAAAAGEVQDSARLVAGAAETSGREADAVAEVSRRAGDEVQAVAASAEELAASVAEITRQVAEGAGVVRQAAEQARATDTTVQGLAEAAQRIGDVVRLIGDIAGQTNLLALNATIEAARAGEAGKGFAVVAGEVKTLAGQTARATEEIGSQIGAIQATTAEAVTALRSIGDTVERLTSVTTAIAAAVEQQGAATREIARSAAEVAHGTTAATDRIGDVRRAAKDTGDASGAMLLAATDLTARADTLRDRTTEFLTSLRRA